MFSRRKIAALVAEFLGTGILAFVVLTVSRSQIGIPYFVAIAAGLAVTLLGLTLGRDVQLNPAYTLALWTARRIGTLKAVLFIIVQILGGMAAYALYKYFAQNGIVQPLPSEHKGTILVAEAFGAFVFAFAAAGALYRQRNLLVRNVITGAAYALGVMVASVAAAGFINPAAALASNALVWTTYVLGPVLGAIIGVNLYSLLFAEEAPTFRRRKAVTAAKVSRTEKTDKDEDEAEEKAEKKKRLNDEAIEVSPVSVRDKPLEKVEKAEKAAKADKSKKNKKNKR